MFVQEIVYALRVLRKKPGFTLIAILVLALGIGANTAIFSVVYSVLWRSLPFKNPDQLVMLWSHNTRQAVFHSTVSPHDYRDFKAQNDVFSELAGLTGPWGVTLNGPAQSEYLTGFWVSSNWFSTLGVEPYMGRGFQADEDKANGPAVAVVSYGFWQRRLGAGATALGKSITLDGRSYQVVGVMPAGFRFLDDGEVWLPLEQNPVVQHVVRSVRLLNVAGRLKPGVSIDQAQTAMRTIASRLESQYPDQNSGFSVNLVSLHEEITGNVRSILTVLLAAVGVVLLIACSNVANLMLVRAVDRQKEVAVRRALGADRMRLVRQFLTESVLLSMIGAAAGAVLAYGGIRYLISLAPNLPRLGEIRMDGSVFAFTLAIAVGTGILFGLIPALTASKFQLNDTLKEGGRSGTSSGHGRLRNLLMISEVALALMLLVGAGLLVRSFIRLVNVDPGYTTDRVLYVRTSLPGAKYPRPEQRLAFYLQMEEKLKAVPGVAAVGAVSRFPLSGVVGASQITSYFDIENRRRPPGERSETDYRIASTDYFEAMGIPLLRGRKFDSHDSTQVAIINDAMARKFWPNEDPIGQRIQFGIGVNLPWVTIVGIAGNVRHLGLDIEPRAEVYRPYRNNPLYGPQLAVRTIGDPRSVIDSVRAEIRALEPEMPLGIYTVEELAELSTAQRRFATLLLAIFAGLAVVLSVAGIYGVMSYTVAQRTHEIGLRMALGAQSTQVLKMIIGRGLAMTSVGIILGLAGALAVTRAMRTLLFEVSATDPATYVAVAFSLMMVALVACYIPARRATKVDPNIALRYE